MTTSLCFWRGSNPGSVTGAPMRKLPAGISMNVMSRMVFCVWEAGGIGPGSGAGGAGKTGAAATEDDVAFPDQLVDPPEGLSLQPIIETIASKENKSDIR